MKLFLRLSAEGSPEKWATGIEIARGCGLDEATKQIEKMVASARELTLELFKADTEGREPQIELGK